MKSKHELLVPVERHSDHSSNSAKDEDLPNFGDVRKTHVNVFESPNMVR